MLLYLISGLLCIALGTIDVASGHPLIAALLFICAGLDLNKVVNAEFRKSQPSWLFWINVGFLAGNLVLGSQYMLAGDALNSTMCFLMVSVLALWNTQSLVAERSAESAAVEKSE